MYFCTGYLSLCACVTTLTWAAALALPTPTLSGPQSPQSTAAVADYYTTTLFEALTSKGTRVVPNTPLPSQESMVESTTSLPVTRKPIINSSSYHTKIVTTESNPTSTTGRLLHSSNVNSLSPDIVLVSSGTHGVITSSTPSLIRKSISSTRSTIVFVPLYESTSHPPSQLFTMSMGYSSPHLLTISISRYTVALFSPTESASVSPSLSLDTHTPDADTPTKSAAFSPFQTALHHPQTTTLSPHTRTLLGPMSTPDSTGKGSTTNPLNPTPSSTQRDDATSSNNYHLELALGAVGAAVLLLMCAVFLVVAVGAGKHCKEWMWRKRNNNVTVDRKSDSFRYTSR